MLFPVALHLPCLWIGQMSVTRTRFTVCLVDNQQSDHRLCCVQAGSSYILQNVTQPQHGRKHTDNAIISMVDDTVIPVGAFILFFLN